MPVFLGWGSERGPAALAPRRERRRRRSLRLARVVLARVRFLQTNRGHTRALSSATLASKTRLATNARAEASRWYAAAAAAAPPSNVSLSFRSPFGAVQRDRRSSPSPPASMPSLSVRRLRELQLRRRACRVGDGRRRRGDVSPRHPPRRAAALGNRPPELSASSAAASARACAAAPPPRPPRLLPSPRRRALRGALRVGQRVMSLLGVFRRRDARVGVGGALRRLRLAPASALLSR